MRPFHSLTLDGRLHRDEDFFLARVVSKKQQHLGDTRSSGLRLDGAGQSFEESPSASLGQQRRRLVFPDPVAFRFLEEDASVTVVERRIALHGYELYLVEQWACSRQSPTLVIMSYTGDPRHSVVVGVLEVPADEKNWSPRLRVYLRAIKEYHARPKGTEIGEAMVTNLSSFPSALTMIPIPDGDIRKHRQVFILNEDLKRLGCSGRSGMSLSDPTPATQAKFAQMYKTSDRVPVLQAVVELVKMCQVALFLFGKLEPQYIDGLLCDVTEAAVNSWWTEIGSEYFNAEPTDGILGPTTVAALLGTLLGARDRLSWYGTPVAKDVFDIEATKRAVGVFQKQCKLERTRRLDRQTMLRLRSVTAKAAGSSSGWGVQKAVKSTVAEIGGKKGEIVMGMVAGRDKASVGEIETLDLDRFISLAHGEKAKWLWYGKPRRAGFDANEDDGSGSNMLSTNTGNKSYDDDVATELGGVAALPTSLMKEPREETPSPALISRRVQSVPVDEMDAALLKVKEQLAPVRSNTIAAAAYDLAPAGCATSKGEASLGDRCDRDALRRTVFKSVAGKVSDARSGLGRIRDAVGGGLKGHASRTPRDESAHAASTTTAGTNSSMSALAHSTSPGMPSRAFTWKNKPDEHLAGTRKDKDCAEQVRGPGRSTKEEAALTATSSCSVLPTRAKDKPQTLSEELLQKEDIKPGVDSQRSKFYKSPTSIANSVLDDPDLPGLMSTTERTCTVHSSSLQRRHSVSVLQAPPNEFRYPRRLSFSLAEEAVLTWPELTHPLDHSAPSELSRALHSFLLSLQTSFCPWLTTKLTSLRRLNGTLAHQRQELQSAHHTLGEAHAQLQKAGEVQLAERRAELGEGVKDIETLGQQLEYEIAALVGRVRDLEDGVAEYEEQVEEVERRADELKEVLETESWVHWFVRTVTRIVTGPNITQAE